jgi:hypothetical protein
MLQKIAMVDTTTTQAWWTHDDLRTAARKLATERRAVRTYVDDAAGVARLYDLRGDLRATVFTAIDTDGSLSPLAVRFKIDAK